MAYIEITYDDGTSARWGDVAEDIAENLEGTLILIAGQPDTIKC